MNLFWNACRNFDDDKDRIIKIEMHLQWLQNTNCWITKSYVNLQVSLRMTCFVPASPSDSRLQPWDVSDPPAHVAQSRWCSPAESAEQEIGRQSKSLLENILGVVILVPLFLYLLYQHHSYLMEHILSSFIVHSIRSCPQPGNWNSWWVGCDDAWCPIMPQTKSQWHEMPQMAQKSFHRLLGSALSSRIFPERPALQKVVALSHGDGNSEHMKNWNAQKKHVNKYGTYSKCYITITSMNQA